MGSGASETMSLRDDLIRDEGFVPYAYKDTLGYLTIGVGFLVDKDKGGRMPDKVRDVWLDHLIAEHAQQLDKQLPWWRGRPQSVQDALQNMVYQLGIGGLLKFGKMLSCLHAGDWEGAKREGLDSTWAKQTPERAKRVTEMFRDV